MTERQQYPEETKAAVMAALLAGQSINQVARDYNIPKGTVSSWWNRGGREFATQKSDVGDLLMEYLRANLATLRAQTEVFSDREWLEKQPASDLAVLHGVMTDKAIRLLESLAAVRDADE